MKNNAVRVAVCTTVATMILAGCDPARAPQTDALQPVPDVSATPRAPRPAVDGDGPRSPLIPEDDGVLQDVRTVDGAVAAINRCHENGEDFACADAVEKSAIAASNGRVLRTGDQICIHPQRAEDVCVTTNTTDEGEEFIAYTYLGELGAPPLHVLRVAYYEGRAALLVDATTGHQQLVSAIPQPSPDGRHLAVASMDLDAAFDANEFVIYRYVGGAIVQELKVSPNDWGPGTPRWLSAKRVELPVETPVDGARSGYRVTGKRTYDLDGQGLWRETVSVANNTDLPAP